MPSIMTPSSDMQLDVSSTVRNSTKANFFSMLMYTLRIGSPESWATVPPMACSALLKKVASFGSLIGTGRLPT